jgi:hypothetical protein
VSAADADEVKKFARMVATFDRCPDHYTPQVMVRTLRFANDTIATLTARAEAAEAKLAGDVPMDQLVHDDEDCRCLVCKWMHALDQRDDERMRVRVQAGEINKIRARLVSAEIVVEAAHDAVDCVDEEDKRDALRAALTNHTRVQP